MASWMRALLFGLALAVAAPAPFAQAQSFEGLGGGKKKSSKKRSRGATRRDKAKDADKDEKGEDPPLPAGMDLKEASEEKPAAPAPTAAEPPRPADAKPAPTMSFQELDVSGKSADRQKLEQAVTFFKGEQYEQAALAAYDLMQDPKYASLHAEAHYLLAKALYRMNLFHSALGEFSRILAKGPGQTKYFKPSLEWLFYISHKTVNETVILDEIAKYSNFEFPEKFRNEFRYLLARYHLVRGKALDEVEQKGEADKSFDEVRRLVLMIPKGDAFYPRAKYLEGLAYFRNQKPESAAEAMREVVRTTRLPPGPMTNERRQTLALRELAFMQLARTHYGARQNRNAIHYYSKVERGNAQWLEALFEASWANYRVGQYEQALGNLITLSSPFFRDEYFPEALILKAVIYYENCRYREASAIVTEFERIYNPVQDQLALLVGQDMDPTAYYNVLADIQKKNREGLEKNGTDLILERVLKLALTDKDLKKTNDSILELEKEIETFGDKSDTFKYSNLVKALIDSLKQQREQLVKKAGIMAKGKITFELDQVKLLIANGLRIKVETVAAEQAFLEEQLKQGGKTQIVKKYKIKYGVSDDELYWPFVGEYWRDELGTYQYTLTKGCIEKADGEKVAGSGGKSL